MFVQTSMPIGGAEMLLVNLIRRMDRRRCVPELCCLKDMGLLGEELAAEIPVHARLLNGKYDLGVLQRLTHLLRVRGADAVITVGAGDKMFWGRLAARIARVPVVASALHSTGWPDGIGWLNQRLTPITDAFIAVADTHGRFLVEHERLPAAKVCVIGNGVDTQRFAPLPDPHSIRRELGLSQTAPVVTIVAALRPEKNHELFLRAAAHIRRRLRDARFLIVGAGPRRDFLKTMAEELAVDDCVRFLGARRDVPAILTTTDVFVLTSHNEANPVSILEAMSVGRPVIATDVGSVRETVDHGRTGLLVNAGNESELVEGIVALLENPMRRQQMGDEARRRVSRGWSLEVMVRGYEDLVHRIYSSKQTLRGTTAPARGRDTLGSHSPGQSGVIIIDG
jgi:glycosyltransferase involved in cell wall biosynthesis